MPVKITQETLSTEPTLPRAEAAALLGISAHYLASLGSKGKGPKYTVLKKGRGNPARYSLHDLREWCKKDLNRLAAFDERLAAMNAEG